jgi:hypothetical protein
LKIVNETQHQSSELFALVRCPIDKGPRELGTANSLEAMSHRPTLWCRNDQNNAPMLRTRAPFNESLFLENTNLPTHSPSVHTSGSSQIAHWQWVAITKGSQNIHRLLRKSDACSTGHTGVHASARQQPLQSGQPQSHRLQLRLNIVLIVQVFLVAHGH